jgi:hypothetical protein
MSGNIILFTIEYKYIDTFFRINLFFKLFTSQDNNL